MKNFIKQTSILSIAIAVAFVVYMGVQIAQGAGTWNPPSAVPPGNNTDEPINVSNSAQTKSGSLEVGGLLSNYSAYLATVSGVVGIGTASPSTGGEKDLKLDVEGAVGSKWYCDENGDNCFSAEEIQDLIGGGGGGGVYTKSQNFSGPSSSTFYLFCDGTDEMISGSAGGCGESDETMYGDTIAAPNGWVATCYDADGGGVDITLSLVCKK